MREGARSQLTEVLKRLDSLIQRMPDAEQAVAAYQQLTDRYLALEMLSQELSRMHDTLQTTYVDMQAAADIVDHDQPVDVAYGSKRPWAGPQPPHYLLKLAER